MNFKQLKILARSVFPDLPEHFEAMPDDINIYLLLCSYRPHMLDLPFWERVNLFSVSHAVTSQLRHIREFGGPIWE